MHSYRDLFSELDEVVLLFIDEVKRSKLNNQTTGEWTVKDVLGHITFWHEYYAQQYKALAEGEEPIVFRSLAGKNKEGIKNKRYTSRKKLINALLEAQETLRQSIVDKKVPKMKYMSSREYATAEFLEVVIGHIKRHTIQVRRAKPTIEGL